MVQVSVLGPVQINDDGRLAVLGGAERLAVALVVASGDLGLERQDYFDELRAADSNSIVSIDDVVDRVNDACRAPVLRIVDDRAVLDAAVDVDAGRFEELVSEARRSSSASSGVGAWGRAIDLWRGGAFDGLRTSARIDEAAALLEELRTEAAEAWFDARLGNGSDDATVVGDLEREVAYSPLSERLRVQQMTALALADRRSDALDVAERFRSDLTEIGLEPSAQIASLERRIIADRTIPNVAARRERGADWHPPSDVRGYALGERLGEGAFAVVYRATQTSVGRDVAVKQIRGELADRPEFIRQFEAEAHLVARLEHPHIVPLYDYWREPGSAYLVMRYLNGGSLADRILNEPLDVADTAAIVAQVAGALDEAHRAEVIHRDVKPANVLLDGLDNAYLSDFGIAVDEVERLDPEAWLSNGSPAYAPPEQLNRQAVGPRADVFALAITAYETMTGRLPFPTETTMAGLLDKQMTTPIPLVRATNPAVPAAVDSVLQRATAKDPADRYPSAGEFADDLSRAAGLAGDEMVEPLDRNPYKGLQAFDEADAADFAGRARLIDKLLDAVSEHRITAVVGPSGSGKSSVVRAGLLPAVRSGRLPQSDQWFVSTMIPGADPFADLEAALLRVAVDPPLDLSIQLRRDEKGLARMLERLIPDDRQLLLAVDQFEELFTLSSPRQRDQFLDALVHATAIGEPRLRVLLTVRADFYDHPLRHDAFARLIEDSTIAVHPLAADELERAITEPARAVGATFEPGLIARITADVADQPGALPLLQYALTELFDRRGGSTLTVDAYDELGGVTGALARRAEELFSELKSPEQESLRRSFGRLVTLGEGSEDTRRRVLRSELAVDDPSNEAIDRFGEARLLSFDREPATRESTVEVAHEALIREWPRLRGWLDEDRDGLRILRHLTETSDAWDTRGRDDADLYRGGRLEAAADWSAQHDDRLTILEREFVDASQVRHEAEVATEAKSRKRLQRLLVGVGAVAIIALIAGGLAFQQQGQAQENQAAAETERMAADAASRIEENPQLALLLAAEAYNRDPGPVGLGALQETLANTGSFLGVVGAGNNYSAAGWLNDTTIAAAGESGIATYDIATGEQLTHIDLPVIDRVVDYVGDGAASPHPIAGFTRTHAVVVPADDPCCLTFVELASGTRVDTDVDHEILWIDLDADRGLAVTFDGEGCVRLFDVVSGKLRWAIDAHPETTYAELPLTDVERAAIDAGWTREVKLTEAFPVQPRGSVHFAEDGEEIVSIHGYSQRFWSAQDGTPVRADVFAASDDSGAPYSNTMFHLAEGVDGGLVLASEYDLVGPKGRIEIPTTGVFYGMPDVSALASTKDGRLLVQFSDRRLAQTDPDGSDFQRPVVKLGLPEPGRFAIDEGDRVAVPSKDGVGIWSLTGDRLLASAFPRNGAKTGTINLAGNRITSADNAWTNVPWDDAALQHVDVATGERLQTTQWDIEYFAGYFAGSPVMASFGRDWRSRTYDPETSELVTRIDILGFGAMTHSSSGLAAYGVVVPGFGVAVFDQSGEQVHFAEASAHLTSADFSSDGSRLAVGSLTGSAFGVWDTTTWKQLHDATALDGAVRVVSYSADDRYLITVDDKGTVTVREPDTLEPIRELIGARGGAFLNVDMVFSDDGRYLLYGGADDIRLWDLEEGVQIGSVFPNDPDFNFGPNDGPQLLTAVGEDLLVWNLDMSTWFDIACQAAGRNLTRSEWEQFGPSGDEYRATCPQWPEAPSAELAAG